ncbi:MAG TPA: transglycosylase domain-containing protein [Mycobacteriales bacterium]|nr:transglycosylase domain-containing protein [Mycobacteriales bacterium]
MTHPARLLARRLALVVGVSTLLGLLLAGAAFPIVGSVGVAVGSGAKSFSDLPRELLELPLPQRSRILAADGSVLAAVYFNEDRVMVPLERIPEHLRDAIVAIEDNRFHEHGGVDLRGLTRALVRNQRAGSVEEGGSTITQQYVKNVLLSAAKTPDERKRATERSVARKVREARYAIELEERYTKDEILERYLNIAYFGQGVYGVGTAAQRYFSKPVDRVSVVEAALLAGLVQAPERYDPIVSPEAARVRRNTVLGTMVRTGALPAADAEWAQRQPLGLRPSTVSGIEDSPIAGPFLDLVRTMVLEGSDPAIRGIFGKTAGDRERALFQGGLTIRTTLDSALQRTALATLRETLGNSDDPASAIVVVEPGTGHIKAMASRNHEKLTQKVNLPIGGSSGFQAGSTFKVFVLAAAIEQGYALSSSLYAPARYTSDTYINVVDGREIPYEIGNAGDSEAGTFSISSATWHSVNTFYLQLQEKTGYERPAEIAEALGVRRFPLKVVPSFTLGATEVSPLDMASAYATLAAHGMACEPQAITSVEAADGATIGKLPTRCERALDAQVADTVTSVLRGVVEQGTAGGASFGRPAAGKTGTTNGPSAAWFVGYTPQLAAAAWVGHPTDPIDRPLRDVHGVSIVYGGGFPATIWRKVMDAAHESLPYADFDLLPPPPLTKALRGLVLRRPPRRVPDLNPTDLIPDSALPSPRPPAGQASCEKRKCRTGEPTPAPTPPPSPQPSPTPEPAPQPTPSSTTDPSPAPPPAPAPAP